MDDVDQWNAAFDDNPDAAEEFGELVLGDGEWQSTPLLDGRIISGTAIIGLVGCFVFYAMRIV